MVFESEHSRLPVFLEDWLIVVYVESFIFFSNPVIAINASFTS